MCADMKSQRRRRPSDFYAHGAREVVADSLTANNKVNLKTQYIHGGLN